MAGAAGQQAAHRPIQPGLHHVFLFLLAFRLLNALALRTFFQPDEYFQSLEPAWQLAFGPDSGAWLTWEWENQLRSSLHPLLFASLYRVAAAISHLRRLSPVSRTRLLLAAPKLGQAFLAACIDFYTFRLSQTLHGRDGRVPRVALALTVASPWQWFCSTRTLSNSLETTLTAAALNCWPWHWTASAPPPARRDENGLRPDRSVPLPARRFGQTALLRTAYVFAALATVLRPTNVLIWIPIAVQTLWHASWTERRALIREAFLTGILVLAASALSDRLFYHVWTFPPLRFVQFNVYQNLAVFYGRNRSDYYLTEGLPLLLTTYLPFAIAGLAQALFRSSRSEDGAISIRQGSLAVLSTTTLVTIAAFSLMSHKEVRFIFPLLPALHVLAAVPAYRFFRRPAVSSRFALNITVLANITIAFYVSQVHQRGVLDVTAYLRQQHEARLAYNATAVTTVGFLMPCHSTPWRSHLIYPGIDAWALTCEPPLAVPPDRRGAYLDEADRFYMNPPAYIQTHLVEPDSNSVQGFHRVWPQYLVFFEQLEPMLRNHVSDKGYRECWRTFNTHWHDDWRRKGDVVVWCR